MIIERCFRSLKRIQIKMSPMYHWLPRRIETHVRICVLAILIERIAELACSKPWPQIRTILDGLQISEFQTPTHRFFKLNEATEPVRDTLKLLGIPYQQVFWVFAPSLKASQFCRHTPVFCDRCRIPHEAASRGIMCFLSRNPSISGAHVLRALPQWQKRAANIFLELSNSGSPPAEPGVYPLLIRKLAVPSKSELTIMLIFSFWAIFELPKASSVMQMDTETVIANAGFITPMSFFFFFFCPFLAMRVCNSSICRYTVFESAVI